MRHWYQQVLSRLLLIALLWQCIVSEDDSAVFRSSAERLEKFFSAVGTQRNKNGLSLFKKWMQKHGFVLHANAMLKYDKSKGMHCVAKGRILSEEEIIRTPSKLLLPPSIPKQRSKLRQFSLKERLVLRLVYEVRKGNNSKWAAYFSILPKIENMHHPLFWTSTEANILTGTYAQHNLMAKLKGFNKFYDKVVQANVLSPFPLMEELKWAQSIVDSRAFTIKKLKGKHRLNNKPFLAPLADMLNHDPDIKVGWKLGSVAANEKNYNKDKKKLSYFRIFTLNAYGPEAGETELVNNYNNELTSISMLMNYGFVYDTPTRIDHLPLNIDIPQTLELYEEREMIRDFMGVPKSLMLYYERPMPDGLLHLTLIIQMSTDEVTSSVDEEKLLVLESDKHLVNAYTLLRDTLNTLLTGYGEIAIDGQHDDDDEVDMRQLYAKRIVRNEIAILDYHLQQLDTLISNAQKRIMHNTEEL